jgi:hypothetical protein
MSKEAMELLHALRIIAGEEQCADNLMSNSDIAREALHNYRRAALAAQPAEPVAWFHDDFGNIELSRIKRAGWLPLYAAPPAEPAGVVEKTCTWTLDEIDGYWQTECGEAWVFSEGGPSENGQNFCHHCGGKLIAAAQEGKP